MSIENIVKKAMENDPLALKAAFEEEMNSRLQSAIEAKYEQMTEGKKKVVEDEEEDCPHCEGMGYHEDENGDKIECPECDGTGKIKKEVKESVIVEGEHEDDEDDDDDDDHEEDEEKMAAEMVKLHAGGCGKHEMYAKMKEKYGCSEGKFKGLYAQHCK